MTTSVARPDPDRLTDPRPGRTPLRWAAVAGLGAIAAVLSALVATPTDVHLSDGSAAVAAGLAAAAGGMVFALPLTALFATLLTTMAALLAWSVPRSAPGGIALRVGLVAAVLTNALSCVSAVFGGLALHLAAIGADPGLVAGIYTGQFVALSACAFPDVAMVAGIGAGLHRARLVPTWVTAVGVVAIVARLVSVTALATSGPFALDGPLGLYLPLTFVVWIIALSAVLLRRARSVTEG
ncbi:hypothetical protein Acsp06_59720 [Actinomycetospora sp. NBRC 106375]|uniref:hypothetical protein n=1 Tax=Actinomycetospora sp. NBRC 106375 TaxID=3032207 RepID=UPI0024A0807F|nr:hypothetical protein [Actinomycetospora sp. NBRC 106375]GLZ49787.1 hypothetical protein Acsp06_59720 [Actinomycetospora sp. NBRC 106375]